MDERRRDAWAALELGPLWQPRQRRDRAVSDDAAVALADAADAGDDVAKTQADAARAGGDVAIALPLPEPAGASESGAPADAALDWQALQQAVSSCRRCGLCDTRNRTVFGNGPQPAAWMLIGEAPGAKEDARGEPFVGQAGRLLDQMLAAIGVNRAAHAFVANVLKCRPPRNRDPLPEEVARCEPYLRRQIELVAPSILLVLGRSAAQTLLRSDASIASLRGRPLSYRSGEREIPVVVTYHPAYLLRTPADKARAWADLCLARDLVERG